MDQTQIALAVESLVPTAQYSRCDTYQALEDSWTDARPIPTEADIIAAAPTNLKQEKKKKNKAIDKKTREIIKSGFQFAGKQFSLSGNAQRTLTGAYVAKDNPAFVYPLEWNTIDNEDKIELDNASTLEAFYLTAVGTVRAIRESGTALKNQVRDATTIAEVFDVEDNR